MFKKRLTVILLALILLLSMAAPAFAVVEQSADYYVADYAGVLRSDTKKEIIDENARLEAQHKGAQIVVVTIDYLDTYEYTDEYANALFNNWGVGGDSENNGMLLLLVVKENKGWLATGAGIKDIFDDDTASDYLDRYFWDEFDDGNYDDAVDELFGELVEWYDDEYGGNSSNHYGNNHPDGNYIGPYKQAGSGFDIIFTVLFIIVAVLVLIIVISIIIALFSPGPRPPRGGGGGRGFFFFPMFYGRPRRPPPPRGPRPPRPRSRPGGFGGGFGGGRGGFGGGFGGGMGHGGGGFSGGGGAGRR